MMKEASLAALQERLVALELLVKAKEGASCTSFPTPNATILAKACALQQSISNLECTSMPHLKDFYKKYVQLLKKSDLNEPEAVDGEGNPLQKNDSELKLATLATKAAIVCSYEEEAKQIASQTKILESYLEMLKNERLDDVPRLVESLKPIENVHLEQVEAASLLNEKFNNMLTSYNNLVNVLSQQFLVWHQLLAAAERQLGLAADTVEAQHQQKEKKSKATAEDSPSF